MDTWLLAAVVLLQSKSEMSLLRVGFTVANRGTRNETEVAALATPSFLPQQTENNIQIVKKLKLISSKNLLCAQSAKFCHLKVVHPYEGMCIYDSVVYGYALDYWQFM